MAWVVATIVFLALHMVPGDPAELLLSTAGVVPDPASVAELREKLAVQGAEPLGSTVDEYGAYLRKELARWAGVVKATGVTLD